MEPITHQATRLHYDLRLELDPSRQFIQVSGSLVYHAPENRLERARFYLHPQLEIESLHGRRVLGYQLEKNPEPPLPAFLTDKTAQLDVYFDPPLSAGETALIQFEYLGNITDWPEDSANMLTPEWVELGMALPWYPLLYENAPANLTFSLQVSCPAGIQVASHGTSVQQNGITYFNWAHPTNDIVVVAAPNLRSFRFESESNRVHLHSVTFSDATVQLLGEDLLWTLERFSGWFGPVRPSEYTLIEAPRLPGEGYARRGLAVLSAIPEQEYLEQREAYLRYLAHEAAHAWWWSAPSNSWEDWLNESFAEYSALMAIRERYGQEAFDRRLQQKREQIDGILPLWGFDRGDTTTLEKQRLVEDQLYHKGPLLLHQLAERVGNRRFLEICRGMQWGGIQDTAHLLDLLEELEDKTARDWLETALKQQ